MQKELKVNKNENLIRNTFEFLSVKDLSLASQVSCISGYFNLYWREFTKNLFCSNVEHYKYRLYFYDSIYNHNINEFKSEDFKEENTDWKIFLKLGYEIKNSWKNIIFSNSDLNDEILLVRNEVYSTLKGYFYY